MFDPQFNALLDHYLAAARAGTLALQLDWAEARELEAKCSALAGHLEAAACERAAMEEAGDVRLPAARASARRSRGRSANDATRCGW